MSTKMITVRRQEKESFDRLLQRFTKKMQGSRVILEVKEKRYHQRKLNKRRIRERALMREFYRAQKEKMKFY